jgi:hypothetical protein
LDLVAGPVALLLPIRGIAQTQVQCTITEKAAAGTSIELDAPQLLPSLLQLPSSLGGKTGYGVLLSNVFSITIRNLKAQTTSLEFSLESSKLMDGM